LRRTISIGSDEIVPQKESGQATVLSGRDAQLSL